MYRYLRATKRKLFENNCLAPNTVVALNSKRENNYVILD